MSVLTMDEVEQRLALVKGIRKGRTDRWYKEEEDALETAKQLMAGGSVMLDQNGLRLLLHALNIIGCYAAFGDSEASDWCVDCCDYLEARGSNTVAIRLQRSQILLSK